MAGIKKDPVDLCNEKLVIFLPKALRETFAAECKRLGLTMSEVLRAKMREFIFSNEKRDA
jgi:hypothetical protein